MMTRAGCWVCLLAGACCLAGCGDANKPPPQQTQGSMSSLNAWLNTQNVDLPDPQYKVQSPDTIEIHCPAVKEIDGQKFVVRPDGKIYVPLVGQVQVGNLTPAQISQVMAQKLRSFYVTPTLDIVVQVTDFKSKVIFVMGQVIKPGIKPYTGHDTVLGVLADAQLNELAWPQKIVIIRRNDDPAIKERVTVNLKEMQEHGKLQENFLLEEGDVVFVPVSPIAQAGLTFGKILYPLIPATNLALMATGGI